MKSDYESRLFLDCLNGGNLKQKIIRKPSSSSKSEALLVQAKKLRQLEELNQSKTEFIASISHELRTPLAIIKQLTLLMYDETVGPINDKQREILVKTRQNIDRLKNMIDNLLVISTLERDVLNLRYSLVNLNHLIKDSREFFERKAREKNIDLKYNLPRKEICIFVDEERIIQVITNLLNNAIKFTPAGKDIQIEVKLMGPDVRIGVIDTGTGIEQSQLTRIFEKFIQVSHASEAKQGIGMGLPIVKELVEKHGGKIWVESVIGAGTRFYFTLPRFYTAHLTSASVIKKINRFLDRKTSVYVVNVLVVNYEKFRQRIHVDARKLSQDMKTVVYSTMKKFFPAAQVRQGEFVSDTRRGRYSVIFPKQLDGQVTKFCNSLKEQIKGYFLEHKIDEAFIALGISTMASKAHIRAAEEGSASIMVRELYIGSEMRRHKRVRYKTKIAVLHGSGVKEECRTIDISQGGICFLSGVPMRIDSEIKIKFKLLKKKHVISAKVRVAWLEKVKSLPSTSKDLIKVGVEFHSLNRQDREALANELKLYYD